MYSSRIELTHSTITLRDDGIIELQTHDDHVYEISDVLENVDAFGKLSNFQGAPVIVIGGSFTSTSSEARKFMATAESLKYSKCEAFILNSLPQRILINFYIKIDKPLIPTKVFKTKEDAIAWCKNHL